MEINKKLQFTTLFSIEKSADSQDDTLKIIGYANTTNKDRMGDVIPMDAWNSKALENYQKNPIILAFHDHKKPIGVADSISVDSKGLQISAIISKAAGEVYGLIKDSVLKAFSIGFIVKDAKYDSKTDIFVITELELLEVSVVSVPANQDSLFSISKAFESEAEYQKFKKQFITDENSEEEAKQLSDSSESEDSKGKLNMDEKELQALIASAAEKAAKEAAEKAVNTGIELGKSGAEKLLSEVEKRLENEKATSTKAIEDLKGALAEKAAEIEALQKSKMQFEEKNFADKITLADKEKAYFVSLVTGKPIEQTKAFANIIQKGPASAGAHVPSLTWETEISTNMQEEIRRRLVVMPLVTKNITMNQPIMKLPVNPEAGTATWVLDASYKAAGSSGSAATHALTDITLNAYKLATKEFIGNEEEEDTILPVVSVIRDAIIRRMSRSLDIAAIRGAGTGADPMKGLTTCAHSTNETTSYSIATDATTPVPISTLGTMRKKLGLWGLDPTELVYVVSPDVYYSIMQDSNFQTMDKVGSNAVLLTGQIGQYQGSPVIVSGEFATKANGVMGAFVVNAGNFLRGNYKGLRNESDYQVEYQQRLLVSSMRVALQQITTTNGSGVSVLKWTT